MAEAKTVWYIDVEYDSYTNTTREPNDDDSWDRGNTSTSHSVTGLKLVEAGGYKTAEVLFKPVKGKTYYLLYASYSTGDTFGYDDGKNFEVIGVYRRRDVAERNEKLLREMKKNRRGLIPLSVEGSQEKHEYYIPWDGYFERLDYLRIESFELS